MALGSCDGYRVGWGEPCSLPGLKACEQGVCWATVSASPHLDGASAYGGGGWLP